MIVTVLVLLRLEVALLAASGEIFFVSLAPACRRSKSTLCIIKKSMVCIRTTYVWYHTTVLTTRPLPRVQSSDRGAAGAKKTLV